jgi:hypothetical protein
MASTNNRDEFIFLNQLLLSMENNVISIPVHFEDRSALFQYKYRREKKKKEEIDEVKTLDFYAAFDTLGPMKGKLIYYKNQVDLNIEVNFPISKKFLLENLGISEQLKNMNIIIKVIETEIQPLYSFTQNNLLDLRT